MSVIEDNTIVSAREAALADRAGDNTPASGKLTGDDKALLAAAENCGLCFMEILEAEKASPLFVEKIPISYARQYGMIGLDGFGDRMAVVLSTLSAWEQLEVVSRFLGCPVQPMLAPATQVATAINEAYQNRDGQAEEYIEGLDREDILTELQQLQGREDLLDVDSRAPVIKLVNLMLFEAVKQQSSDVHIQPFEEKLVVRMRIDGLLFDVFELPKSLQEEIISRVKIMGRMNIAEKRLAQDGRATVQVGEKQVDLRIASIPTSFGERIVVRLLNKSAQLFALDELGMGSETLGQFRELVSVEHGLILVTGPTGSGKSTTLYAVLQEINSNIRNILTLEDPIEYQLPGVSQTQVSDKKGMTFASGLRSVLRQDPDVIMVGEIRDQETAVMAIQSALTGHLVFSTLHTNDAASAVTRLLDLGIEPYLVASSVVGVLAQRLARRVCDRCGQPYKPAAQDLRSLGIDPASPEVQGIRRGAGCANCRQTGYRKRVGLFELLAVDDEIQYLIQDRETAAKIKQAAIVGGMHSLADDGIRKMLKGRITLEEVGRLAGRKMQ